MRKAHALLICLLAGLIFLSACTPVAPGREEDEPAGNENENVNSNDNEAENVVEVELVSYEIHMPMTLDAGTITFHVVNNSQDDEHSIEIEGNGIEEELEPHLEPGEEGALTVDLAPGTYRVYCPVDDHADEHGMEIEITVK
jgi:uncharacterized cupredoxin-like copper-binding protein